MRITNKIMQNNSLYNINSNKVTEDAISTSIMTGKKVNRPSDDPVVAIRALRLRANVTELNQYYEKNVEDAEAWLQVTEGALTSISGKESILVDLQKLLVAGPDKYKTLSDWQAIVTQIEQLSDEYYNVGNVDYAGRYAFTGFRTDTSLSFLEDTSKKYEDIQDEFNAGNIDTSDRVTTTGGFAKGTEGTSPKKESDVSLYTVGRLRLSYDKLDALKSDSPDPDAFRLQYRENMVVAASSTVLPETYNVQTVNVSFTTKDGASHTVHLPVENGTNTDPVDIKITNPDGTEETYTATYIPASGSDPAKYEVAYTVDQAGMPGSATYTGKIHVNAKGVIYDGADPNKPVDFPTTTPANYGDILAATTSVTESKVSEVKMTAETGTGQEVITIPLAAETKQPYEMTVKSDSGAAYTVTVNTDGTYTLHSELQKPAAQPQAEEPLEKQYVVQLNNGGAVHSSYVEVTMHASRILDPTNTEDEIDEAYKELYETYAAVPPATTPATETGIGSFTVNAATGEILLSKALNDKLTGLRDIINANTLNTIYDKTNFVKGDTRPENLFACTYDGVKYNIGTGGHTMEYDVGYNQKIEVNTMANDVFTNDVKREAQDLRRILDKMQDVDNKIKIMETEYSNETDETKKKNIQIEIDAAKKAYDYLTDVMKDEFGAKITGVTKAINMANNAVTVNGTRSKRLDLISSRLMDQVATFQELQSENEDVDLAEAGTMLAMARLTYEASLNATGKIMTQSLMDYI